MLAFNLQLKELLHPVTRTAGWVGATTAASLQREPGDEPAPAKNGKAKAADKAAGVPVMDAGKAVAPSPLVTGVAAAAAASSILDEPATRTGPAPMSQTVWTGGGDARPARAVERPRGREPGSASLRRPGPPPVLTEDREPTALESLQAIDWTLPPIELLEVTPAARPNAAIDHASNIRRIEEKLRQLRDPGQGRRGRTPARS